MFTSTLFHKNSSNLVMFRQTQMDWQDYSWRLCFPAGATSCTELVLVLALALLSRALHAPSGPYIVPAPGRPLHPAHCAAHFSTPKMPLAPPSTKFLHSTLSVHCSSPPQPEAPHQHMADHAQSPAADLSF